MKVVIMMGLPGSGKTTLAKQLESKDKLANTVVDLDKLLKAYGEKGIERLSGLRHYFGGKGVYTYIIDGLVHTNEQLEKVIREVVKNEGLQYIKVYYWSENRERCLLNDEGRRELSSKVSIKNLPLDRPCLQDLQRVFERVNVEFRTVLRKPDWLVFAHKHGLECSLDKPYLESDTWCIGGTRSSIWGDEVVPVQPDVPPSEFVEFEDLIKSIKKDISHEAFKELFGGSVTMGVIEQSDYYGGGSINSFYQCDVRKLYSLLVEMNLLEMD